MNCIICNGNTTTGLLATIMGGQIGVWTVGLVLAALVAGLVTWAWRVGLAYTRSVQREIDDAAAREARLLLERSSSSARARVAEAAWRGMIR